MATVTFSGTRATGSRGLFHAVSTAWHSFVAARRSRREIASLASMSDYMLADLGINRATVDAALSQPFWTDPSKTLVQGRLRNLRDR